MLCRMLKPPPLKKYPKTQKQLTKRVSYKHFNGGQMVVYQSDQIKLGSRLVESKVHMTSMEADRKQTVNSRKDQHENRTNTYKRIAIVHVFIRTTRPGGVRSKFSQYFFFGKNGLHRILRLLVKYENRQLKRKRRRTDWKSWQLSVIRWSVTEPYEKKYLTNLIFGIYSGWQSKNPHKTSNTVDLIYDNIYWQIYIIITAIRLKIKKT